MDNLKELKAQAYDAMVQVEVWKKRLNELNQQIGDYKEPEPSKDQPLEKEKLWAGHN